VRGTIAMTSRVDESPEPRFPELIHVEIAPTLGEVVDPRFVQSVVGQVLNQEGPFDAVELTVHITDDKEIQSLNRTFRGVDHATDVLSFAFQDLESQQDDFTLPDDISNQLGDVVISYPAAVGQAKEYGHDLSRELAWLIVHGLLQLLGYRHETQAESNLMRAREESILGALGLTRPASD
jgi:probable rRNA maturation factor